MEAAIKGGNPKVVKILANSEPRSVTDSVLQKAMDSPNATELLKVLLDYHDLGERIIMPLLDLDEPILVRLLIERNVDLTKTLNGTTPAIYVAKGTS